MSAQDNIIIMFLYYYKLRHFLKARVNAIKFVLTEFRDLVLILLCVQVNSDFRAGNKFRFTSERQEKESRRQECISPSGCTS